MNKPLGRSLLATAIAAALTAGPATALAETLGQDITDARQETQIWTTYALSPYLRALDLKVEVHGGKATLTGAVDEDISKDLAREIAMGVSGITEVDNRIVVQPDYVPAKPGAERSYGETIDDASVTTAVKSKLTWSKYTDGLRTEVATQRGKVTLSGTADSTQARDLAGRLAANTRGVVAVDNQLVVKPGTPGMAESAGVSMDDAGTEIADTWITTKVKSTFMYSSNVAGSDIEVSTAAGVVTLSGKLASGAERALAIELAGNVRGVRSVNSTNLTI